MKECCKCKTEFDLYEYEGKVFCQDCLLKELGLKEKTRTYYANDYEAFWDMDEVCDYYGVEVDE